MATMGLREAALQVLRERGPLHYQELTDTILAMSLATSASQTPAASLNATIAVDIKQKGIKSDFIRVRPGVFGLRGLHQPEAVAIASTPPLADENAGEDAAEADDSERRVRIPLFPLYSEVRHLLRIWPGRPRKQVTGLRARINELRGTPQKNVDWSEPDSWIPERLDGAERELAQAIWTDSAGAVNPRHTYGHWLFAQKYQLVVENEEGLLCLTDTGRDFLDNPSGAAVAALDEAEGLLKLLSIIADNGPARPSDLLPEWSEYLTRRSAFGKASTFEDTLRRRLANLRERELVGRKGTLYSLSERGLKYLEHRGDDEQVVDGDLSELRKIVQRCETSARESMSGLLHEMDPFAFEHLVKRLLEEMEYQNVEVTSKSGDGGVDVVADIELGITSVREVVQAKRHKRTIQRKDLDALRGSLYRFNAVRGTIITTSRFAKGTQEAAFATGAAPITLIDGEKLIDLLIEYGIGVRKRTVEVLEVDPEEFSRIEADA